MSDYLIRPPVSMDDASGPRSIHIEGVITYGVPTEYTVTVDGGPYTEQTDPAVDARVQALLRTCKFYELANLLMGRGELTEPGLLEMYTTAFPKDTNASAAAQRIYRFCLYGRIVELLNKDDIVGAGRLLLGVEDRSVRGTFFRDIAAQSVRSAALLLERLDLLVPQEAYVPTVLLFVRDVCLASEKPISFVELLSVFSDTAKAVLVFVRGLQDAELGAYILKELNNDELLKYICLGSDPDREIIFSLLSREKLLSLLELLAEQKGDSDKKLRVLSGYVVLHQEYFTQLPARAAGAVLDTVTTTTAKELLKDIPSDRYVQLVSEMWNSDKALLLIGEPAVAADVPVEVLVRIWGRADRELLKEVCHAWDPLLIGKILVGLDRKRLDELQDKKIISKEFVQQAFKALS